MSQVTFTGERLHEGSRLFGVDLARHHAAYEFAAARAAGLSVIDLGCGSGYGAAKLVSSSASLVGLDRIAPDSHASCSDGPFSALPFPFAESDRT